MFGRVDVSGFGVFPSVSGLLSIANGVMLAVRVAHVVEVKEARQH